MDKIAIVILNWNGQEYLNRFVPSVAEHSKLPGTKIWVADNGSTDESVQFLKDHFPEINLVELGKNYGFTGGYNKALKQISAEFYVLLNSDVEVTTNWLEPLLSLMESDSQIAACMPKIKAYNAKTYFEYAGAAGGFIDKYGFPFCRGRIFNHLEKDERQYDSSNEIFWATGACMFIRSNLFHEFKGFDEDFFAHMEEIDLCWRLKNSGYSIMIEPNSVVYHVGGGTLPNESPRKLYLNFRNNLWLLFKNLPEQNFRIILFKRQILDGIAAIKYLAGFQYKSFWAVLKAHIVYYKKKPMLIEKRNNLMRIRTTDQVFGVYPKSIVISFFLKKIRIFNDLKW